MVKTPDKVWSFLAYC